MLGSTIFCSIDCSLNILDYELYAEFMRLWRSMLFVAQYLEISAARITAIMKSGAISKGSRSLEFLKILISDRREALALSVRAD
jgi:hypothetical protein